MLDSRTPFHFGELRNLSEAEIHHPFRLCSGDGIVPVLSQSWAKDTHMRYCV